MVRQTGDSIIATVISETFYARNNLHILLPIQKSYHLHYIVALLNSKLINYCYSVINPEKGEALAEVKAQHVEQLPIHPIDFSSRSEKATYDKMVSLVSSMLDLNKKLPLAKTDQEKTILQRQIDSTDRRIDELVYDLYGLTDEEIKIVEGAASL